MTLVSLVLREGSGRIDRVVRDDDVGPGAPDCGRRIAFLALPGPARCRLRGSKVSFAISPPALQRSIFIPLPETVSKIVRPAIATPTNSPPSLIHALSRWHVGRTWRWAAIRIFDEHPARP